MQIEAFGIGQALRVAADNDGSGLCSQLRQQLHGQRLDTEKGHMNAAAGIRFLIRQNADHLATLERLHHHAHATGISRCHASTQTGTHALDQIIHQLHPRRLVHGGKRVVGRKVKIEYLPVAQMRRDQNHPLALSNSGLNNRFIVYLTDLLQCALRRPQPGHAHLAQRAAGLLQAGMDQRLAIGFVPLGKAGVDVAPSLPRHLGIIALTPVAIAQSAAQCL